MRHSTDYRFMAPVELERHLSLDPLFPTVTAVSPGRRMTLPRPPASKRRESSPAMAVIMFEVAVGQYFLFHRAES